MTIIRAALNVNQRRAVEHGSAALDHPPLPIIAGAGSGKTKATLVDPC